MDKKAKTVIFFSMDALGHVNPIISIAYELRRRGHRTIVLTTRPLGIASKLESMGIETDFCYKEEKANSPDQVLSIVQSLLDSFRQGPKKAFEATYNIDGAAGRYLSDVREHHSEMEKKLLSYKPDLIIVDHVVCVPCATKVAPRWVRFISGFPSMVYSSMNDNFVAGLGLRLEEMTPQAKSYELEVKKPLRLALREFSEETSIPDWDSPIELAPSSPYLNLYLGPEEIGLDRIPNLKHLPESWLRLEHTIDESVEMSSLNIPEEFNKLPGKLIYFSLGTLVSSDSNLINKLLNILKESPNKFIVSMGPKYDEVNLFANMWGDKFVDQKAILPKVDLFITHGGHNSIIEAFYYGVAGLIIMPVFADQFDLAQRIMDSNLGIRLNPFECSKEDLLSSIENLLKKIDIGDRMRAIGRRMRSIKYHEIAACKLETLLGSNLIY